MNYQITNRLIKVAGTLLTPCSNIHQIIVPVVGSYFSIYGRGSLQTQSTYNRYVTTYAKRVDFAAKPGTLKKLWKKLQFYTFYKSKWKATGFFLYESVADNIDYEEFFREMSLPDTFNSWFIVTELHIWMLMVRVMDEGDDGRYIRNCIVASLWDDTREKIKKLGAEHYYTARDQLTDLSENFQAALLTYDEGLLGDDKALASALWRRFFSKECCDAEQVEQMVQYVRRQMYHFDNLSGEDFLKRKHKWVPLKEK